MGLKEFLALVLPAEGDYFTSWKTPTGNFKQQIITGTLDDVITAIDNLKRRRTDVYYGTASYNGERKQTSVKFKKAWYVDIDCREGGQYASKADAIRAIRAALDRGLPPPTCLVDSGGGYHPYWIIHEEVTESQWKSYAAALETACDRCNLFIDSSVTKDSARVLRVPTSLNFRDPSNPTHCEIVREPTEPYTFEEFCNAFNPFLTAPTSVPVNPALHVDNSDLSAGTSDAGEVVKMLELCPMFKDTLAVNGKGLSEPLWRSQIHLLAYCDDGEEWIHAISSGHAAYSKNITEVRFKHSISQKSDPKIGPTLCARFATLTPQCKECEWNGRIKTPWSLRFGRPSDLPWPYRNGDKRVEKYYGEDEGWLPAIPYNIRNYEAKVDEHGCVFIAVEVDAVTLNIAAEIFVENRLLAAEFARRGVPIVGREVEETKYLMASWMRELRNAKQVSYMIRQFGWVQNGFAYGGAIYAADGTSSTAYKFDSALMSLYSPVGELAPWSECANHILTHNRPASACAIAAAFGAPLVRFTNATGALLSIASPYSGTGKSTALQIGQAVWGHPIRGMSSLNDTDNSVLNKLGALNTLPAYWDEVRGKEDVQKFATRVIFRLAQGREKARMTANLKQRDAGDWKTLMIIGTNEPIYDHIAQSLTNTDAGAARVFEIAADDKPQDSMNNAEARHFFGQLEQNYGVAGQEYAKFLVTHEDYVKKTTQEIDRRLSNALSSDSAHRYWIALIACLIAGAKFANELGLCTFDLKSLSSYLISQFKIMQAKSGQMFTQVGIDPFAILQRYIHEKVEYIVKADGMPVRGTQQGTPSPSLKVPPVIRIGKLDKKIRLITKDFESWIYNQQGSGYTSIIDKLIEAGAVRMRGSVDAGTLYASGIRTACLEIELKGAFSSLVGLTTDTPLNDDLS